MSQDARMDRPGAAPLGALRRFVRPRVALEMCDLCSAEIAPDPDHPHLLDPATRQILCACNACAILFSGQKETKYRRIPEQVRFMPGAGLTDAQWDALLIPVGMAFFFYSSPVGQVLAFYPSPAGPTESLLPLEAWAELVADNPLLATLAPDVEALLVNRVRGARESYLVPIDQCYRLVGLIRTNWRGLSGGAEVWQEIDRFFQQLQERAQGQPARPDAHA